MIGKGSPGPAHILTMIRNVYEETYHDSGLDLVKTVLGDVVELFAGSKRGFPQCDTVYHNLAHTFQIIPPFIGIIDGRNKSGEAPSVTKRMFDLGIAAVLLHDTGYIKSEDDSEGTGAKYTFRHILRSIHYAEKYLSQIGLEERAIRGVQNMIMCTGVVVDYGVIPFASNEERITGYALGTADLLGQMSVPDYLEKLPLLYQEFEEAYHYEGIENLRARGVKIFESPADLIRNTPDFYEKEVRKRLENMGSVHRYLTSHFTDHKNHFIEAIEKNMTKIRLASLS